MNLQRFKNLYHGIIALAAAVYYGFPGRQITVIGVTGTDGKTTTTHLIHHILKSAGKKASMVSSVYAEIAGKIYDTGFHVTTPDSWMLQKFLRAAVESGEKYMVLEVTSHALDQHRVLGIPFQIAVLTNVSHEHLDYHKTYENYLHTKEQLLLQAQHCVINEDDTSFAYLQRDHYKHCYTYAVEKKADTTPKNFKFKTPLPGIHNTYNCLAGASVARILGISDPKIAHALAEFAGVKGRYERVKNNEQLSIIIDFAHTPNAFAQVLPTAKKEAKGKLIHVFGSAALRDETKRPLMGALSAKYADYLIVTEEDFRTESVDKIIDEIAQGALKNGAVEYLPADVSTARKRNKPILFRIPDRMEAVLFAIATLAQKGDSVILTGKAHEKSLCRGTTEYPWSEHEAVAKALTLRKKDR